jgi:hypothetical protein
MKPPPCQADALLARARRLLSDHGTRAKRVGVAPPHTMKANLQA